MIVNPQWGVRPVAEFPERAAARGVLEGSVELSCNAESTGRISNCEVVSETPAGVGFASAALSAMRSARIEPREEDGEATASRFQFVMRFRTAN